MATPTITPRADTGANFGEQLHFARAAREILTSANAAGNDTGDEIANAGDGREPLEFTCPRCSRGARERFYGPCGACRRALRGDTCPPPAPTPPRAPRGAWALLGAELEPVAHLGELVERFAGAEQLWLTRPALERLGLPLELERGATHALLEGARAAGWTIAAPTLRSTLALWLVGTPLRSTLEVPAWDRSSPWHDVDELDELEGALSRFVELVGVPWGYSGAITSDALLRELSSRSSRSRIAPAVLPPPAQPTKRQRVELELDFIWCRPPAGDELGARFAHAFDVNGAYLSAASSLALPAGEPEHRPGAQRVDAKLPGLWLVDPPAPLEGWPDVYRPQPLARAISETARWVTTPTAALAGEALEAWVFPQHHRSLEGWYSTLRDARTALLAEPAGPALAAVKAVYKQGIGRLGSSRRTRAADAPLEQPLWRAHVIAMARARLWRRIAAAPAPPFAIGTDCVWWLSDEPNPAVLAKALGLELSSQLGKFKHAGSAPGDAAREIASAGELAWRSIAALREVTR